MDSIDLTSDDKQLFRLVFTNCLIEFLLDKELEPTELYCYELDTDFGEGEFAYISDGDVKDGFIELFERRMNGFLEYDDLFDDLIDSIAQSKASTESIEEKIKPHILEWLEENYKAVKEKAIEENQEKQREQEYYDHLAEEQDKRDQRAKMPYADDYLRTDYWLNKVRPKVIQRDKCCRLCGKVDGFNVHHITYQHRGDELNHLEDLTLLCCECHQLFHAHYE